MTDNNKTAGENCNQQFYLKYAALSAGKIFGAGDSESNLNNSYSAYLHVIQDLNLIYMSTFLYKEL